MAGFSAFAAIWQFLRRVPWPVYAALAIIAAWGIDRHQQYRSGYSEGRESVLAELRAAEAEALKKAATAARKADKAGEERALIEAEARAEDIAAIERAVEAEANPLDALF